MVDRVGQQFGNYRLLREIGKGAFAAVYLGEHQHLERPAAIKVLHAQMESQAHESFLHEARIIAHLQHPHIVHVYDFGIQDQTPYLVMEYTSNGTLRSLYPTGTRLTFAQIVTYAKQVASALDYAHQQRVIHCDVKPANLLLNIKNEVILSDFGIAVVQRTLDSLSLEKAAGTPLYMAPEQIQHHPCAASDQYALGVMVYEWLCGEPLFRGSVFEVWSHHLHQPPPSLCSRLPHLTPAIEDAVFRALAKDPQRRFATVQDFATVLEKACFATQPPSLHMSQQQDTPLLPPYVPISVPITGEQKRPDTSMQLVPMIAHRPGSEQAVAPRYVTRSHPVSKPVKPSVAQRNRQVLLRKVYSFWIEGVLKHSLHGASLMAVGLQAQPDAVVNPWHLVLQHPDTTLRPLPGGTRITQVYDDADGELLILGAPGSGKTTLLLELARDLLERAERDEQHPMPVVLNLSSWAMKQQCLTDWLVEELLNTYQVPRKVGQAMVDAGLILPLLDGLDEVAPKDRTACIMIINTYRQEHGLSPLVVCSRSADYLAQTTRVLLRSAVMVQPFSPQQVDTYLRSAGAQVEALRVVLHRDPDLQELATTPLMLSILTLAYRGMPLNQIVPFGSLSAKQQQIFATYTQRMLTNPPVIALYTPQQTMYWLGKLAKQLKQQHESVFYMEHMHPNWLPTDRSRRIYSGFVGGLVGWLIFGLIFEGYIGQFYGYSFVGMILGSLMGLMTGVVAGLETDILPQKMMIWSWRSMKNNLIVSLSIGMAIVLLFVLLVRPPIAALLSIEALKALPFILAMSMLFGIIALKNPIEMLDDHTIIVPNQGIKLAARNGVFVGLLIGLLVTPLVALVVLSNNNSVYLVVVIGLLSTSVGGLVGGGFTFIKHYILRLMLWRSDFIPWNYSRFLDFATECILLRRVGGGYIFVHRLLLEYFASLDTPPLLQTSIL